MWVGTHWNKKVKLFITGFFLLIILMMNYGSKTNTQTNQDVTHVGSAKPMTPVTIAPIATAKPTVIPTPTVKPTSIPEDANGFPADADYVTISQITKVPSAYNGKKIVFTCNVTGFAKNDNGDAAALNCSDPNDYSALLQVGGTLFDLTKINKDDTVKIYGLGAGAAQGKNAFGGAVTEAIVDGLFINDLTTGYKN
jgi:hypothetical protein